MSWLSRLVERRIEEAQSDGRLSNLAGEGKPLSRAAPTADAITEAGYRMMAEEGVVPEEVTLHNLYVAAKARLAEAATEDEKRRAMAEFAEIEMRRNMALEAHHRRRRF